MSRLSSSIISDHEELRQYYSKYQSASGEERVKFANLFRWKLAIHSVAEELILYPVVERLVGAGAADKDRGEHETIKQNLTKLESLSEDSSEFGSLVDKLFAELSAHLTDEENVELPALEEKLSEEESISLGAKFERSRKVLPTYTQAGAKPPFESVSALFSTPLDKVRELFASPAESSANK